MEKALEEVPIDAEEGGDGDMVVGSRGEDASGDESEGTVAGGRGSGDVIISGRDEDASSESRGTNAQIKGVANLWMLSPNRKCPC